MKRQTLERHLEETRSKLEARSTVLKDSGLAAEVFGKDPVWRTLDADRRQVLNRLSALSKIEQREIECAARKAGEEAGDEE